MSSFAVKSGRKGDREGTLAVALEVSRHDK
jgi:hypothetical protein